MDCVLKHNKTELIAICPWNVTAINYIGAGRKPVP